MFIIGLATIVVILLEFKQPWNKNLFLCLRYGLCYILRLPTNRAWLTSSNMHFIIEHY